MTIPLVTVPNPVPLRSSVPEPDFQDDVEEFLEELPDFATDVNATATAMNELAGQVAQAIADADQVAADRVAVDAIFNDIVNATNSVAVGTSTASVAIGTGSKSFAAGAGTVGKIWPLAAPVFAVSQTDATKSMWGKLTAYNPTTGAFTMNSQVVGTGTGTVTDWVIYLGLPQFMIAPNSVLASKTDTASTTSTSWVDTGLEVSITLKDAASKVQLRADVTGAGAATNVPVFFRLTRAGSPISQGDAASSRTRIHFALNADPVADTSLLASASGAAEETPGSAGPHTYKLQWRLASAGTGYLNRTTSDGDGSGSARGVSTLSATEISA